MANPISVPGTVVPSGSLLSPGGAQGVQGIQGPTAISADAGNIATLGSDNLILVPQQTLWYQRLRSFNAIGNPTFEVDQRNVGSSLTNPGAGTFIQDRWYLSKIGTMTVTTTGALPPVAGNEVVVPGTNFMITRTFLRIVLTGQEASLAATDALGVVQSIEGPRLRELFKDVHSLSILCRSNAALSFGIALRDAPTITQSLTKLCTIPAANVWTLITLPNIPVFPAGNFSLLSGAEGYRLNISLAAGTSQTAPANNTWQSGNFTGAVGQTNFASLPVNTFIDFAFVQHEPGTQCTTPIDCPFGQNLDGDMGCLRYFQKSYDYEVAVGAVGNSLGLATVMQATTTALSGTIRFPKLMAKNPTTTIYNHATGAANSFRHLNNTDYSVSAVSNVGKGGFYSITTGTMPAVAAGAFGYLHYTADTGW